MRQRTDHEGENYRAHPDGSAEEPPNAEHDDFHGRACRPQRPAKSRVDSDHQAIAGARPEARTDVKPAGDSHHEQARRKQHNLVNQDFRGVHEGEAHLHAGSNQQSIQNGSKPRHLSQRNPEQQDHTARDHDNPAETPTPGNVQPLGEDGPGVHTEACFQHHGCGKAEQKETGKKLNKPSDGVEGTRHSSL